MTITQYPFENKVAIVTGSGRGIGRAIALRLAHDGADVLVNYVHNRAPAEEVVSQIIAMGRKSVAVRANVGKIEDIGRLFEIFTQNFDRLDMLVNNAASGFNRPALEQKETGWDFTMNVNARSALFTTQLAVPIMQKNNRGVIINISSPGSNRVMPDYVAVGASKAALESLTRYLAVELAPLNIVVNAVAPGLVETDALQHFSVLGENTTITSAIKNTPAGRLVEPIDIAGVVAFLCSPAANMIRGQVIMVDGGYTLGVPR